MELLREEDKLIQEHRDDPKCLNLLRAFMSDEDKKAYYTEYNNNYREKHHDELVLKANEKIQLDIKSKQSVNVE